MKTALAAVGVGALLLLAVLFWRNTQGTSSAAPRDMAPAPVAQGVEALLDAVKEGEEQRAALIDTAAPEAAAAPAAEPAIDGRASLRTRFVNELGAAIAGARLEVLGLEPLSAAESDAKGEVELELDLSARPSDRASTLVVQVTCRGFARDRRTVTLTPGSDAWLPEWTLVASCTVAGRVFDAQGRGVGDATVACLAPSISWIDWSVRRHDELDALALPGARATSGPDGSFTLDECPHGTHRLVAVAEGWLAGATEPVELRAGEHRDGVEIRLGEAVGSTHIAGTVLDPSGVGVASAPVMLRSARESQWLYADERGRFVAGPLGDEIYELLALDPREQLQEATAKSVARGTQNVVLRLTQGRAFELVVLARDGSPIEEYAVEVRAIQGDVKLVSSGQARRPLGTTTLGVPGREFAIDVRAPGCMPASLGPLAPSSVPERVEIRLAPAAGISGVVIGVDVPIAGAQVAIHREVAHETEFNGLPVHCHPFSVASATTGSDGAFLLPVTTPRRYHPRVQTPGGALAEVGPLALDSQSTRHERVHLARGGSIEAQVRSSTGRDVAGHVVCVSRGDGRTRTSRSAPDGKLVFERLTPGRWQVLLVDKEINVDYGMTREGTTPAREVPWNCEVVDGAVTRVDVWVEDRGLEACVLDGELVLDGRPAESWQARLEQEGGDRTAQALVAQAGRFRISVAQPGPYRLLLTTTSTGTEGVLVILDRVELRAGDNRWSLTLDTGSLEGRIVTPPSGKATMTFHRWEKGSVQCLAPVLTDAAGKFRCPRVASGAGRVVRFDPTIPWDQQQPEVLAEVEVAAGESTALEVP